jgi:mRNA-degrading endonuclease YafQ of YafQ-DinJ toxin-antitoxin module
MRSIIWGKTFVKAFKRTIKKHPDIKKDIEKALRLLPIPFSYSLWALSYAAFSPFRYAPCHL